MSREAFGDPPESQEPPQVCPVCGGEWHAEDCEFGKEVSRRLKAERDAHKLAFENEQLHADLRDFLRHVVDMSKGDHYWDVVRGNAEALLRRKALSQTVKDCLTVAPVAARCEGCAELRDQLRDLARQSNLDAMRVGKLAEDVERYSALHARLFAEKTAAQIDAESMRELLYRMLEAPTTQISPSWKEEIRPALVAPGCKTPAGCRENGCLGWCDEHKPPVATRCEGCAELRDQLREKAAWCDELERDAERYRFVRTADKVGISAEAARDPVAYDAAIDRAMERAKI